MYVCRLEDKCCTEGNTVSMETRRLVSMQHINDQQWDTQGIRSCSPDIFNSPTSKSACRGSTAVWHGQGVGLMNQTNYRKKTRLLSHLSIVY